MYSNSKNSVICIDDKYTKNIYKNHTDNISVSTNSKTADFYVKNDKFPTGYRLFTNGGAENAMMYCNRYLNKETGKIEDLTDQIKKFINTFNLL